MNLMNNTMNKKSAIVIGGGVIGLSTAYYLKNILGMDVTVLERNSGPALETSHANGCQISACHSTPWSNPSVPKKLLSWLWKGDSPLLFRPKFDLHQWKWLFSFLKNCTKIKSDENLKDILTLCLYSRNEFKKFVKDNPKCKFDYLEKGILHIYRDRNEFLDAERESEIMNSISGLNRKTISKNKLLRIENAFYSIKKEIQGATFTESDMSGDIYKFCKYLSNEVKVVYNTNVIQLLKNKDDTISLVTEDISVDSNARKKEVRTPEVLVICAASFSNKLLNPIGLNLQIYPAKGYSATIEVENPEDLPFVSITDDENKLVYSRLGDLLRVAGTAELSGYEAKALNYVRCQALIEKTKKNFPKLRIKQYSFWTGLRPLTPSNRPYVCKVNQFKNLYLNTGHGSLGWTESLGSAKMLTEIIRNPDFDLVSVFLDGEQYMYLYKKPYSLDVDH